MFGQGREAVETLARIGEHPISPIPNRTNGLLPIPDISSVSDTAALAIS